MTTDPRAPYPAGCVPPPWIANRSVTCGHLRAAHNYRQNPHEEWTDADMRLVEAAPALYRALKAMFAIETGRYHDAAAILGVKYNYETGYLPVEIENVQGAAYSAAQAALAAAEGRTP